MAASKSKNTGHSGRNTKKKTAMEQEVGRFQTEIILFVILAACVILMASNFGAGGFVGDAISNFCFGLMGLMAYLFPIVFFLESAFILINKQTGWHIRTCSGVCDVSVSVWDSAASHRRIYAEYNFAGLLCFKRRL